MIKQTRGVVLVYPVSEFVAKIRRLMSGLNSGKPFVIQIKNENLENRVWQTAYVISALSDKTWNQIMQNFEKVEPLTTITVQPKQPTPKPKIVKPKTENLTNQNTATVINSVVPTSAPETEEGNWFSKLLSKFFSVF